MNRAIVVFSLLSMALCACRSPEALARAREYQDAADDAQCVRFGAHPGTQDYLQCRLQLQQLRQQDDAEMRARYQQLLSMGLNQLSR